MEIDFAFHERLVLSQEILRSYGQSEPYTPLPTHIIRRGPKSIVTIDELCMGLRPTHWDENRFEPKPLRSNWHGTAKTGATLDELRPFPSLVWDACLNQSVSRHPSRWDGW